MRIGGNPDLAEFSFKCKIADIPAEQYSIRVAPGTKKALREKFGEEASNKVREAIAKLLEASPCEISTPATTEGSAPLKPQKDPTPD